MTASATTIPIASHSAYPDSPDAPYPAAVDAGDFFDTLLDIVNPLQHIPIVSNLYREVTGDTISSMARMVGGAVFGGPVGFASATANVLLEQASGGDVMDHAVALVTGDTPGPSLHAAARTAGPPLQSAENALPEADFGEIAWSGPRVLPSLARRENTTPLQMVNKSLPAGNTTTTSADTAPTAEPVDGDATSTVQLAATGPDTAKPDWMADALLAAKQAQAARSKGNEPELPAQPWATNAMMQALEKYEALSRPRNAGDAAGKDERS